MNDWMLFPNVPDPKIKVGLGGNLRGQALKPPRIGCRSTTNFKAIDTLGELGRRDGLRHSVKKAETGSDTLRQAQTTRRRTHFPERKPHYH